MRQLAIQPALISDATEYFTASVPMYQLNGGYTRQIDELPEEFATLLADEIRKDKAVQRGLRKIGITDQKHQIKKFYDCNFSAFDDTPDVSESGQIGPREYIRCDQRGNCQGEGQICKTPCNLTVRQVQIAIRIAEGQQDDRISAELFISKHTLRKHKNHIEVKIGLNGKPSIATWTALNLLPHR